MPPRLKRARPTLPPRSAEVLDVHGAAALLMVSADTVYDLFGRGEMPGRKVGRKWITGYGKDTCLCRARHKSDYAEFRIMPSGGAFLWEGAPVVIAAPA